MNERNATREESAPQTPTRREGGPASAPSSAAPPSQLGAYRIQARLGQGGMGTVYRAWHTRLKRAVALKTLRAEYVDNASAVARFHREMEAVGKLDHPNLIRATDAGEDHGIHFLAMEFVEGLDAARLSQVHGPLSVANACEVVRQAAAGLQYVHENGLVHRDIEPSNLMVTPAGRVKVLDLGLALLQAADETGELTGSNQWMGTADYMAPEQGLDAHGVDIRADVYSLGCTLYKLLAGQAPFGGSEYNTPYKKMDAHARRPAPPLRQRCPDVPPELAAVVERIMAKAPADRFATPGEVAEALTPFTVGAELAHLVSVGGAPVEPAVETPAEPSAGGETGPFGPPTPASAVYAAAPPPSPPWSRRLGWAVAFLAVACLAAALLTWWPRNTKGPATPTPPGELTPGVWHNLLDRSPTPLYWPTGAFPPQFDDKRQRLLVNCSSPGLLSLGTVPSGVRYQVHLGFVQPHWTGGVGLFFGYHEDAGEISFQEIVLAPMKRGQEKFGLTRSRGEMRTLTDGQRFPMMRDLAMQDLRPLSFQEHILDIDVGKSGPLSRVRWDGGELADLTRPQTAAALNPCDYHGQFGIVVRGSSAEILTARLLVFEKD